MTTMDGDRELVAGLKAGECAAFDQLYAAYNSRLFNFLARLARRRDVAEDLLEETWLRVVRHTSRLRADTRLAPWLFTIARNTFVSYCRSRHLDYGADAGMHLWPVPPPSPSPFEAAAAGQLQQRVEVAMATLPAPYREVLLLVAVEGMTPAEASIVCGVTPEAMRQRLSRARAMLAERLEGTGSLRAARLREVWP
jgi:RNA polymerase sigma-70 factor (ECF subfamily)